MSKDELRVSDNTAISMPMRNLLAIIAAVSVGVWAYFGVLERLKCWHNLAGPVKSGATIIFTRSN